MALINDFWNTAKCLASLCAHLLWFQDYMDQMPDNWINWQDFTCQAGELAGLLELLHPLLGEQGIDMACFPRFGKMEHLQIVFQEVVNVHASRYGFQCMGKHNGCSTLQDPMHPIMAKLWNWPQHLSFKQLGIQQKGMLGIRDACGYLPCGKTLLGTCAISWCHPLVWSKKLSILGQLQVIIFQWLCLYFFLVLFLLGWLAPDVGTHQAKLLARVTFAGPHLFVGSSITQHHFKV